jgi:predicted dehydrogenase
MRAKKRGAILGGGNIALRGHAPQWVGDDVLARTAEIVAVADLSATNRQAMREVLPKARYYERAEDLLAAEELDFCDICTPPFTHRDLVLKAAARGLHVLCEKPMAPCLEDAQAMAHAARAAGIVFQPCHQHRYSPLADALRLWLPRIGRVYMADYEVQRCAANEGSSHWKPDWRTERALAGGGVLFDHGVHIFYQLREVLGVPTAVQAATRTLHHDYGVEDTAFVLLDFGRAVARVHLTWAARHREIRFRYVGEAGEISGNEDQISLNADRKEEIRFEQGLSANSSHSEWYAPLLRDFVARLDGNGPEGDGLEEALDTVRFVTRAYESCASGRRLGFGAPLLEADPDPIETLRHPGAAAPVYGGVIS